MREDACGVVDVEVARDGYDLAVEIRVAQREVDCAVATHREPGDRAPTPIADNYGSGAVATQDDTFLSSVDRRNKVVRVEVADKSGRQRQRRRNLGRSGVSGAKVAVLPPASGVEVDWGEGAVDAEGLAGGDLADKIGR